MPFDSLTSAAFRLLLVCLGKSCGATGITGLRPFRLRFLLFLACALYSFFFRQFLQSLLLQVRYELLTLLESAIHNILWGDNAQNIPHTCRAFNYDISLHSFFNHFVIPFSQPVRAGHTLRLGWQCKMWSSRLWGGGQAQMKTPVNPRFFMESIYATSSSW